jgi:hypothetical protein
MLEAWRANPVVMGFGEVPSALESGVIDGLMTSIGGWLSVREQAPFYTTGGAGAFTGDYYMVSASRRWWDRLTRRREGAGGADRRNHPGAEGVQLVRRQDDLREVRHQGSFQARRVLDDAAGSCRADQGGGRGPANYVKSKTPPEANKWVDAFVQEGRRCRSSIRPARPGSRRWTAPSTHPRSSSSKAPP